MRQIKRFTLTGSPLVSQLNVSRKSSVVFYAATNLVGLFLFSRIFLLRFKDLRLVWLYPTDLMAWYERSLAIFTTGKHWSTDALGFPSGVTLRGPKAFGLDGLQLLENYLLVEVVDDPVLSTNLLILIQVATTLSLSAYLFKYLLHSRTLAAIAAISLSLVPATIVRIDKPNIAFAWPYVAALTLALILVGQLNPVRKSMSVVTLTTLTFSSGAYALSYSAIVIFLPTVLIILRRANTDCEAKKMFTLSSLTAFLVFSAQAAFHFSHVGWKNSIPVRNPADSQFFQSWNLSNFVPSHFSRLPGVHQVGIWIYENVFLVADPGSFCLGTLSERDSFFTQHCSRLTEVLSFGSFTSALGNYLALVLIGFSLTRFIKRSKIVKRDKTYEDSTTPLLTYLILWSWLVGSFGFGMLVSSIFPPLRMWGRIGLLVAVLSTTLLLVKTDRHIATLRNSRFCNRLILSLIILIVILDQGRLRIDTVSLGRQEQISIQHVSRLLSRKVSPDCPIVSFPSRQFAHGDVENWRADYHEYRDSLFALYAPSLRWSGGRYEETNALLSESIRVSFRDLDFSPDFFVELSDFILRNEVCGLIMDEQSKSRTTTPWFREQLQLRLREYSPNIRTFSRDGFTVMILVDH